MNVATRKILFRVGALALILLIAGAMFIFGRGHTVYLDNKTLEYNGQTYNTPYRTDIFVNGEQIAKLYNKERGMSINIGQKFTMTLEITDTKGGDQRTTTITMRLPYSMDGIIVNLPGLLAGLPQEAYIEEFVIVPTEPVEEEIITDEFSIPEDDLAVTE